MTTTAPATTATLPRIAINQDQFSDALFQPGGTYDGYIDKQLKNGIRLFFRGETYVLNHENVFCLATKQSDGKTWYSYGGQINALPYATTCALAELIREMLRPAPDQAYQDKCKAVRDAFSAARAPYDCQGRKIKAYSVQYMDGKTRRFSCSSYAEAVQKAHASRRAVADISEL